MSTVRCHNCKNTYSPVAVFILYTAGFLGLLSFVIIWHLPPDVNSTSFVVSIVHPQNLLIDLTREHPTHTHTHTAHTHTHTHTHTCAHTYTMSFKEKDLWRKERRNKDRWLDEYFYVISQLTDCKQKKTCGVGRNSTRGEHRNMHL